MKRLIICSDGTWNIPDQVDRGKRKPSNVVKLARGILPRDEHGVEQVVFYDTGVGTYYGIDRLLGGAFGIGLSHNILEAYRFLVYNYAPGDELYFFGFSRGAFTVRSLAGFIQRMGLLPKDHAFYLPEAWQLYRERTFDPDRIKKFKEQHLAQAVPIYFLGVWDTVGSLGIPVGGWLGRWVNRRHGFHDVHLGVDVRYAYQALALDEFRKPFRPTLWEVVNDTHEEVIQAWFAGSHTNIGGGYDNDGLANCALHWIHDKAKACGLATNEPFLKHYRCWMGDELRPSLNMWYRLAFGRYLRGVGVHPNAREIVHASAVRRMEYMAAHDKPPYEPSNLVAYLKRSET